VAVTVAAASFWEGLVVGTREIGLLDFGRRPEAFCRRHECSQFVKYKRNMLTAYQQLK